MSRRFSDEPINLIHRIPTPEQLSAVRPQKRSLTQSIMDIGTACIRRFREACAAATRVGRSMQTMSAEKFRDRLPSDRLDEETVSSAIVPVQQGEISQQREDESNVQGPTAKPVAIQADEVSELRTYLLTQQQDIARLSAQLHELKSLVVSQQQVLVYIGKELEMNSLSAMPGGVASASGKRHRPARDKVSLKDKTVVQKNLPKPPPLSL
jgi:NAD-specific glutamate dehydrogenase